MSLSESGRVRTDVLVVGSGIAGLSFALKAARYANVLVATKKERVESNTNYAQGGVAAVFDPADSPDLHLADTLVAGAGLCHQRAVEELVREGPERIRELIEWGVNFTREQEGFALGREAGHSRRRILHAADLTGHEIERALIAAVARQPRIEVLEDHVVWSLCTDSDPVSLRSRCSGALVLDVHGGRFLQVDARAVVLAAGGCAYLYWHTTNPEIATGDGIALGYAAGAAVANLEFVQFHPTALYPAESQARLISEAVRGEGAVLRRLDGFSILDDYHPAASLGQPGRRRLLVGRYVGAPICGRRPTFLSLVSGPEYGNDRRTGGAIGRGAWRRNRTPGGRDRSRPGPRRRHPGLRGQHTAHGRV